MINSRSSNDIARGGIISPFPAEVLMREKLPNKPQSVRRRKSWVFWFRLSKKRLKYFSMAIRNIIFLAEKLNGEFGTGTGEEYGEYNPEHGTYHPVWMSLADVLTNNVMPRELADLVVRSAKEGWYSEPVIIIEEKRQ
jgi:hypothetical protein